MVETMTGDRQTVDLIRVLTGKAEIWKQKLSPEGWAELIFEVLQWIDLKRVRGFKPLHVHLAHEGPYGITRRVPIGFMSNVSCDRLLMLELADIVSPPHTWEDFPKGPENDPAKRWTRQDITQDALFLSRKGDIERIQITWSPSERPGDDDTEVWRRWAVVSSLTHAGAISQTDLVALLSDAPDATELPHAIMHSLWLRLHESNEQRRSELRADERTEARIKRLNAELGIL